MKAKILYALLGAAVLLFAIYAFQNMERTTEVINTGPEAVVKRNPFLAASLMLEGRDIHTEYQSTLIDIDYLTASDLLILSDHSYVRTQSQVDQLSDWVYSGGHLVFAYRSHSNNDQQKLLADKFGFTFSNAQQQSSAKQDPTLWQMQDDPTEQQLKKLQQIDPEKPLSERFEQYNQLLDEIEAEQSDQLQQQEPEPLTPSGQVKHGIISRDRSLLTHNHRRLSTTQSISRQVPLTLNLPSGMSLYHPALAIDSYDDQLLMTATTNQATTLIQIAKGKGKITVLSSTQIWGNQNVALLDHAALLWQLSSDSERVIFQEYILWPSLITLLLDNAAEVVVSLSLLLLLWLLAERKRFGPLKTADLSIRRSIAEHISASGRFHWRHKHKNHLLSALRAEVYDKIKLNSRYINSHSDTARYQVISEISQISVDDIAMALEKRTDYKDQEIHQIIHLLKTIRDAL